MINSNFLFQKRDIAPLAVYRILMGTLMAAEGFGAILTGWVRRNYVEADFTFNFIGFDFLQIIVGPQAYAIYATLGVLGVAVALGYRYRLAILAYTVLWAAVYLGQKTSYNNHYYLLLIMCGIFCFLPAHKFASLDVKQGRVEKTITTPYWHIWIFKILLLIVYTFASLAKIYPDWLDGTTVGIFLSSKADMPVIGLLSDSDWFIYLIAYGGIFFDLLVIPALWWKPTRKLAFGVSIFFHLFNSIVFKIGIFPYMMLIASVLFFDAKTIRKLFFRNAINTDELSMAVPIRTGITKWTIGLFLTLMLALPIRHFFYPGSSHWTEEAHRLSWHMMLRSKWGTIYYEVKDEEGKVIERVYPSNRIWDKRARKLATRPDMAWQYAQRLSAEYRDKNMNVTVHAHAAASLNGRPVAPIIDPNVDLASVEWSHFKHSDWILPHPDLD
ncbi:MAG: HTTM domain-containing protein [Cryomorphaceae bacterium]|nr:HTTM domain-containing protein [Flavobacteriales bacterium]